MYRKDSDAIGPVRDFLGDFRRLYPDKKIEELDPDSSEGINLMRTYDLTDTPAIISINDDGTLNGEWCGRRLPLLSEVAYYS
jgi:hypothetical protein